MSVAYLTGQFGSGLAPGTVPAPAPVNGHAVLRYTHILQRGVEMIPITPVRLPIIDGVLCSVDGVPSTTAPIEVQATDDPLLAQTGVLAQVDLVFEGGSSAVQVFLQLPTGRTVSIATAASAGAPGAVYVAGLTQGQIAELSIAVDAALDAKAAAEQAVTDAGNIASGVTQQVQTMVPTLVEDAIAADPTVANAAAAAMTDAAVIAKLGPVKGTLPDGTDLNSITTPIDAGLHALSSGSEYPNNPFPGVLALLTVATTGLGVVSQEIQRYGTGAMMRRHVTNYYSTPVTWSPWEDAQGSGGDMGSLSAEDDIDTMYTRDHAGSWRVEQSSLAEALGLPLPAAGSRVGTLTVDWITGVGNPWAIQTWRPFDGSTHTRSYGQGSWSAWRSVTRDVAELTQRVRDLEGNGATDGIDPARLIAPLESRIADIALWGDSNLQSGGTATRLRELLPESTVHNYARSGQYASLIAARQGGVQALITVNGNTIPATGPVAVYTSIQLLFQTARPALSIEGTLAGVHGTLSVAAGTNNYTFHRTNPGDPVPVAQGTPFWADIGRNSRDAVSIFWVGGNNPDLGVHEYNLDMAAHLTPAHKRFIVMPCINLHFEVIGTPGYEDNMRNNRAGAAAFGDRWLDHRTWLIHNGLDAAGITPTQEDLDAIAGDAMPPSLTSDGAHFTGPVQRIIGDLIHEKMQDLGWVS